MGEAEEREFRGVLRAELGGWRPGRGPDLRDLVHRADQRWRAPVVLISTLGAAALAVLLLASLAIVVLGPAIPGGDVVRSRLVGP